MKKGVLFKNNCICREINGALFIDPDCHARFTHNGKKTVIIHELQAFRWEDRFDEWEYWFS